MGRRSRDAGADTSRCTRAEILTDTGAASHRNLAFTALVQVSRPCLLAFLAWVVEHRPTQGPSLQLAPCRCPFRLTNSRLELTLSLPECGSRWLFLGRSRNPVRGAERGDHASHNVAKLRL